MKNITYFSRRSNTTYSPKFFEDKNVSIGTSGDHDALLDMFYFTSGKILLKKQRFILQDRTLGTPNGIRINAEGNPFLIYTPQQYVTQGQVPLRPINSGKWKEFLEATDEEMIKNISIGLQLPRHFYTEIK